MNSPGVHPMDIQPVIPEPQYMGASPPPRWYDPQFSKAVTILSAIVLSASVTLVVWFTIDIPKIGRVADPEKALEHMVSRIMDVEEGFKHLPAWEHALYEVTMGSDASERDQAISWYEELVAVSADPRVELNLAILLAESGRVQEVTKKITEWTGREIRFRCLPICCRPDMVKHTCPWRAKERFRHNLPNYCRQDGFMMGWPSASPGRREIRLCLHRPFLGRFAGRCHRMAVAHICFSRNRVHDHRRGNSAVLVSPTKGAAIVPRWF